MHGIVKSSLSPPQSTFQQAIHSSLSPYRRNPSSEMTSRCSISSSKEVPLFQSLKGIQQLAETRRFKAWFLDQFGVLHDGKQPYPGAISTCMRNDAWFAALGRSCIHMTWNDRGAISLEGLGLQVVDNVDEAEFILAHGTEALGLPSGTSLPLTLEDLEEILTQCAVKNIPMVVANPDFVTVEARALRVMPGTLASKYEKLGGEVKWMGKPDEKIYKSAMAMAGVDAVDCIAVGDSLHHDIKGANIAGIQSAFITCGIHATELGLGKFGDAADSSSVQALALRHDAHPSYVLPAFMW
ncbi:hypothetical protein RHMOL_Rhmol02G0095400 [Rhododendron molle]|uniref:Uncharacterized protein n=1 Tax=Rhododendron molle TaxID=49168 RepID=A0ACC0PPL9_RHOML|nr:hypothetical protein RHMOL_Rhmol02G0095400 [Rhododendron molle]